MAQIVVRGIEDVVMRVFREQAKARGVSAEQAVRELITDAVAVRTHREEWLKDTDALRERLRQKYGSSPVSAAELIREDRDSR